MIKVWKDEYRSWRKRSLATKDYVYVWADGMYFGVRLEENRPACLMVIGVLPDGRKELIPLPSRAVRLSYYPVQGGAGRSDGRA